MRAVVRRKLEMASRVLEFLRAHPSGDATVEGVIAKLAERIARADTLITQQRAGLIAEHASAARRLELRRGLQSQLLRYLVRVGELAAKVRPELAMRFQLPELNLALVPYLSSVKAMLALAESERELLISVGLSESALAALKREVKEFEDSMEVSQAGRRDHVGASADLGAVTNEVLKLIGMLDAFNQFRYRKDADLLAGWNLVTKVRAPSTPHEPRAGAEGGRGASAA